MNRDEFTPNQSFAIATVDRPLVVTAGPGAGKTLVLVERALYILKQRMGDLDEIVAITFTNKAANEMKEKIRRTLMNLARESSRREEARRWYELKQRLEDAAITTIHGFCARILRSQPVEARVDPNFSILDEYEGQLLLNQAVEEIVNEVVDTGDQVFGPLVIGYTRRRLIEALSNLYLSTRALGFSLDQISKLTCENLKTASDYGSAVAELEAKIELLGSVKDLTKNMQTQVDSFLETFHRYLPLLRSEPKIEEAHIFDECMSAIRETKIHKRGRLGDLASDLESCLDEVELTYHDACARETIHRVVEVLKRIDGRYTALKEEKNGLDYEDLQWKARELLRTRPHLARSYADAFKFILVDEFQDTNGLQKEIIDLLVAGGGEQASAKDYGHNLRAKPRQPNLFIVGDVKQSVYNFRGAAVEVFAQAEREVKERGGLGVVLEKNFRSTEPLVRFYNEFFSRLMASGPRGDPYVLEQLGYVEFIPGEAHREAAIEAPVELLLEIGEHIKDAETGREIEARRIADRIARMVQTGECLIGSGIRDLGLGVREKNSPEARTPNPEPRVSSPEPRALAPVRYGDIALLFRAMTDIKIYERALRQRGIPYYVLAGKGFYERQEIQDILSFLHFLENRTDEIALVSALRSPLFGLSDETLYWLRQQAETRSGGLIEHHPLLTSLLEHDRAWGITAEQRPLVARAAEIIARLLELRNRVPLVDLLREILDSTGFEAIQATAYDGHQRVANLRKLLDLARRFEASGPHFLSDFTRFVRQFTEMETRESEAQLETAAADAVKIMTIHKAKGLEFPVVLVPDLARSFHSDSPPLTFDRGLGIGLKIPDPRGRLHNCKLRERVIEQINLREFFESQRLLFVAATRAQDYLILSGAARKVSQMRDAGCGMQDTVHLASRITHHTTRTSWLDWVCSILGIDDPNSLSEVYEWNGVKLRITLGAESEAEQVGPGVAPLIERFPELAVGQPVAPDRLPSLSESDGRILEGILRCVEPTPQEPTVSSRPISVTQLIALARCPLQFYYESVLDLPPVDEYHESGSLRDGFGPAGKLSPAIRGRIVHRFCELCDGSEPWDALLRRIVEENIVATAVTQEGGSGQALEGDLIAAREAALDEVRPLVENYLKSDVYRTVEQIIWGVKPGRVESEVEFVYRTRWMSVRGRIDRLIITEDGAATIIDYKTNQTTAEQLSRLVEEYTLQLQIYTMAVRQAIQPKDVRAELYFLYPDVRVAVSAELLEDGPTAALVDELCQTVAKGRRLEDFPARPEAERCRRCPCFSFCPES